MWSSSGFTSSAPFRLFNTSHLSNLPGSHLGKGNLKRGGKFEVTFFHSWKPESGEYEMRMGLRGMEGWKKTLYEWLWGVGGQCSMTTFFLIFQWLVGWVGIYLDRISPYYAQISHAEAIIAVRMTSILVTGKVAPTFACDSHLGYRLIKVQSGRNSVTNLKAWIQASCFPSSLFPLFFLQVNPRRSSCAYISSTDALVWDYLGPYVRCGSSTPDIWLCARQPLDSFSPSLLIHYTSYIPSLSIFMCQCFAYALDKVPEQFVHTYNHPWCYPHCPWHKEWGFMLIRRTVVGFA